MYEFKLEELIKILKYENFIIFGNNGKRLKPNDILLKNEPAYNFFQQLFAIISNKESFCFRSIQNRMDKINKMMSTLRDFDELYITKFTNRIWDRYRELSNLGENFIDFNLYLGVCPTTIFDPIIINRTKFNEEVRDNSIPVEEEEESIQEEVSDNIGGGLSLES